MSDLRQRLITLANDSRAYWTSGPDSAPHLYALALAAASMALEEAAGECLEISEDHTAKGRMAVSRGADDCLDAVRALAASLSSATTKGG